MAIREIVVFPDDRLRGKCTEVTEFNDELKALVEDMFETMYDDNGIGLAAPQVAVKKRLVVMDVPKDDSDVQGLNKLVLINPKIINKEGSCESEEGCLSVPEYRAKVDRFEKVSIQYFDENGVEHTLDADGLLAICIQHELDHLDGRLFIDYLSPLKQSMLLKKYKKLKTR